MLKGAGASRMPALTQYAEAEALLKNVHKTSNNFESNLATVLQSRQSADIFALMDQSTNQDRSAPL